MSLDLFAAGQDGRHTYRIPSLLKTSSGSLLAFAEGRREHWGDTGSIDLVMRRFVDEEGWSEISVVVSEEGMTCGNPCPVLDESTGTIWLLFCKNRADGPERAILEGNAPRTVWVCSSDDEGLTWSEPREITSSVKKDHWTWYATGPGHGVQAASGALVVPCDHALALEEGQTLHAGVYRAHVVVSRDGGKTWSTGAVLDVPGGNESAIVRVPGDDTLYFNARYHSAQKRRLGAWSLDHGQTWDHHCVDEALPDPICQGSLCALGENIVFCHAEHEEERKNLVVRASGDGGKTWGDPVVVCEGPVAYSDMVALSENEVGVLFECGEEHPYEKISWVRVVL